MCGIIGYIGNNCLNSLINGLEKLEYRGYDSSGIALNTSPITIFKDVGKVNHLKTIIDYKINCNIGIGHTRWATHGKPNKINAHPQISYNRRFALVHNGVIENYLELKEKYLSNVNFVSSTDTEVIVNLLAKLAEENSLLQSLNKLNNLLKGSYALVIIDVLDKENLYFLKNQTPLVIGHNTNEMFIASDYLAFNKKIKKQIIIKDKQYGFINKNNINIYNKNGNKINYKEEKIIIENIKLSNNNYQYHMEKEIYDEPLLIDEIINHYYKNNKLNIKKRIINKINQADKIYIIACGSSYYSGNLGKYYFEHFKNKPVEVILASEALYDFPLVSKKPLFIFISQSGETLDVINVIKLCKEKKYYILGITNSFNSTITHLCNDILYLYAGREISVASTKAVLGQCIILLLLAKNNISQDLINLKEEIKRILLHKEDINSLALTISKYQDVFILGKNLDYYIALEGALKLKEISYIHAEAFSSGELKHGSLALIDNKVGIIGLLTQKDVSNIMRTNLLEASSRGGNIYTFAKKELSKQDNFILNDLPIYIMPLSLLVCMQLLSFFVAKIKNNEIDTPRNLAKSVTVE